MRVIPLLDICKLTCEYHRCQVKIEVNQNKRGIIGGDPQMMMLKEKAQDMFNWKRKLALYHYIVFWRRNYSYAVPSHPRNLFDIKHLTIPMKETKRGFIFSLLGSDRPIHESFAPSMIDQRETMGNLFAGMSDTLFTYQDFEETRTNLIKNIRNLLTESDRKFLISLEEENPCWSQSEYAGVEEAFPSVQWKLLNLQKFKKSNPKKLQMESDKLKDLLEE